MKVKSEVISVISLAGLVAVLIILSMRLWNYDLAVPFYYSYSGADKGFHMAETVCTSGLGDILSASYAEGAASISDIPMYFFSPLYIIELKFMYAIFGKIGMALNLVFFLNIYLTALVSYTVMRKLQLSCFTCVLASAVFAMSSFGFVQETYYNGMSLYCFVPLAVLMCLWILEDEEFFRFGKDFFKNKRTVAAMIFMMLIAVTGSGYYLLFTGVILLVAGVSAWFKTGRIKAMAASLVLVLEAVVLQVIYLIPYLAGSGVSYVNNNVIEQSEILGLKLFQFFIPAGSLGIKSISDYMEEYAATSLYVNENTGSYLGLVGLVGFVILILALLLALNPQHKSEHGKNSYMRVRFYAELTLGLILLGETGGFGTMLVLLTGTRLVAYNRVSIFIVFISIVVAAMLLDWLLEKVAGIFKKKAVLNRLVRIGFCVGVVGFACLSVLTQVPEMFLVHADQSTIEYHMPEIEAEN